MRGCLPNCRLCYLVSKKGLCMARCCNVRTDPVCEATPNSEPSWFGFPITIRDKAGINRVDLLKYLDQNKIGTRLLFAGNLTRQPYFEGRTYRVSGELERTDEVMNNTFWIGVYPGLDEEMLNFVAEKIEAFLGVNF